MPWQSLWCCHHIKALREFTLVHVMNAARRQVAGDLWTKPIGLNHKPACRLPVNYTHHRHFIITQPESWYSFTIPQRIEGWVDLGGGLHTEMVYPFVGGQSLPSIFGTGQFICYSLISHFLCFYGRLHSRIVNFAYLHNWNCRRNGLWKSFDKLKERDIWQLLSWNRIAWYDVL